jgi:hypothetical protein
MTAWNLGVGVRIILTSNSKKRVACLCVYVPVCAGFICFRMKIQPGALLGGGGGGMPAPGSRAKWAAE